MARLPLFSVLTVLICNAAAADELVVPKPLERVSTAEFAYRFDGPLTGAGSLDIEWSDAVGRVVERRVIPLELTDAREVVFSLDIRRAVAAQNRLAARFSFDASGRSGGERHWQNEISASFIAPPFRQPWSDYQIVMWQRQTSAGYATLKKLGITAGMVETSHRDEALDYTASLEPLLAADLRCYLENIATDFYSPYHKWYDDRPVNWRFTEAKKRYWANRRDRAAFIREPSLSDPQWIEKVQQRLMANVRALHPYRPLYYSLGDETGIGNLAAFWDFDLSDHSLAEMRNWLRQQYGSLDALNRQWTSGFASWDDVVPMTTDEALQRAGDNFSAWVDFKEWMDVSFARALERGTRAVHSADPDAIAAIEGAQIPGWGGYDYSRLATSVDAMELYDYGENVVMARSFNPELIMLTTSFQRGPWEAHRVWRELLRGTRGLVLWDSDGDFVGKDGVLGARGREAAPYFSAIRTGIGALLINSEPNIDGVGMLYSPASRRVQWLLDRKASIDDWSRRGSSTEYQDDAIKSNTRQFAHALAHMGLQYRFVSSAQLQQGDRGYRVLILPHAIALGAGEAMAVRDFVRHGGVVIADGEPGLFDEHGRRLPRPALSDVFDGPPSRSAAGFAYGTGKAVYLVPANGRDPQNWRRLSQILDTAGVRPLFPVRRTDGQPSTDIETYTFRNGELTILALQRDLPAIARLDDREAVVVKLPKESSVCDIRARQSLGTTDQLEIELGPVEPALLTLSEKPVAPPMITGPRRAALGAIVEFGIEPRSPAARGVLRLDVVDPDGTTVGHYSRNLIAWRGMAVHPLPLALNDKTGVWKLRVTDLAGGETSIAEIQVGP